ncbi:hypothetical protein [Crocosphaera sp.]|uniref:hypothetical protein n=1 Tax=Crocosphaera sp. TaxID=2729996 RepID=UPI00262E36E5|nr:hypothetical protein [Crocosphaera sp.]MDJ0581135.1 hypothetical protein [Crocosphaera sp.]
MTNAAKITDPWHHSQSWSAHGHQWQFTYNSFNATYTIENSDRSIILSVPIRETDHYPSPQAWLDHWAKTKGKHQLKQGTKQSKQPSLLDFNPQSSNSIPPKNPKGISFGQTLEQLYQGKTCTRRVWSDRTAKTFIRYYEQGIKVPAYNKGLQYGGEIIGWLTLTEKPVQQPLVEMTQADLKAEGFPNYTFEQFINEFFEGKNQPVWVICFQFTPNQPQESSVTVEVVESNDNQALTETDELTDEEERDLLHLERKVERAFYEAGKALCEIRDRQLYRTRHQTFETYVKERFSMKQSRSYQLMDAAIVVDNLLPKVPPMVEVSANDSQKVPPMVEANDNLNKVPQSVEVSDDSNKVPPMVEVLPTSERQVRPLTKLEPDQQREAWAKAVEQAGGKVPSGRIVKSIVDKIRERKPVPNPWHKGDVAMIMVKDNPDLRGKGGCWCVITEVHDFSCTVRLWDGNYQVKPENLKELPYSNEQQEEVRKLCDRLSKITLDEVEKPMKDFLRGLGKIDRPWLTDFEEKVLRMLEESNI